MRRSLGVPFDTDADKAVLASDEAGREPTCSHPSRSSLRTLRRPIGPQVGIHWDSQRKRVLVLMGVPFGEVGG